MGGDPGAVRAAARSAEAVPSPQTAELTEALLGQDDHAARDLSTDWQARGHLDDLLSVLARHAPANPLALDLLLEALEASGTVRRFAAAVLLDEAAVEDVSQESLLSIASSVGTFTGASKVTTWVHSIVRRRAVDHLRRQRETVVLAEGAVPAERFSSRIADRVSISDALEGLAEPYRTVVVLRDVEGLAYAEISERLERPVGTVKAQISRGRALVAERISRAVS